MPTAALPAQGSEGVQSGRDGEHACHPGPRPPSGPVFGPGVWPFPEGHRGGIPQPLHARLCSQHAASQSPARPWARQEVGPLHTWPRPHRRWTLACWCPLLRAWARVDGCAVETCELVSWGCKRSSPGSEPGREVPGHLHEPPTHLPTWLCHFASPPVSGVRSRRSTSSPALPWLRLVCFFNCSHSDVCSRIASRL